ncbi:hypothetical protein [Myxosarcina sp. GI1]|uniref:hypothetical protein n=1 Tax=Myxosarcina sp. GI1 TaxID=1541065 RepID=UPI0012E047F6|nr:hypothetical protein [Myxosarcina sp. GI1]
MTEYSSANNTASSTEYTKDSYIIKKLPIICSCATQIFYSPTPDFEFDVRYGYSSTKFTVIR